MYCSKCGNKIEDNDKFCRSCGNSIIITNDKPVDSSVPTPLTSTQTSAPFCTNCGEAVGKSKICPRCHLKTKKNYKKYCRYCGGTVGEKKKCSVCGSLARISVIETIVRFFITALMVFFYLFALGDIFLNKQIVVGLITLIGTLVIHIFVYRKKQIKKFKTKLVHKKARKLLLSLIYVGIFIGLIAVPLIGTALNNSVIGEYVDNSRVISYSENIIRQTLKNPSSMKINNSSVEESFTTDDNWTYYKVVVDYSAQNEFGGYGRNTKEIYVRSFEYADIIQQVSATDYITIKLTK